MRRYGIIDVGSNTIRLCIYEVDPKRKGASSGYSRFNTLLNHKAVAGLASYIEDGRMSDAGIAKAVKVINEHLGNAEFFRCAEVRIFATACLRNCENSAEAVARIEAGIGGKIDLLPGSVEAHLGFLGATIENDIDTGILVDIGGGSVELTRIVDGRESAGVSLPQGSLSSFAKHVAGLVPTSEEMDAISMSFRALLDKRDTEEYATAQLYGIGGSVRGAMKVYGDLFNDGNRLDYLLPAQLDCLLDAYRNEGASFTHRMLHTVPDRVHTFIPGCLILQQLFQVTGAKRLDVAKKGLREGYLLERVL